MSDEEQLAWEGRVGGWAGVAAFTASTLTAVGLVIQASALGKRPENERERLLNIDAHGSDFLIATTLQVASVALIAFALYYLLRATLARRPETPSFALGLVLLAPVLYGVGSIINDLSIVDIANRFVESNPRTVERAKDLRAELNVVGIAVGFGGALSLALSFVLVSINAMRAGLLNGFTAILGVAIGVLSIVPLLPGGVVVVQILWLGLLGLIVINRFPGGRGPAWATVEAIPWLPASRRGRQPAGRSATGASARRAPDRPSSSGRKRKRKRRR